MSQSIIALPLRSWARLIQYKSVASASANVLWFVVPGGKALGFLGWGQAVVLNAATVISVTLTWTDPDVAGTQTENWIASGSQTTGVHPFGPTPFVAKAGSTVTVSASAATEANLSLSVDIWGAEQ